jgi:hypothetical protein
MLYIELSPDGSVRHLHYAPYLDYRPLRDTETRVDEFLAMSECSWIDKDVERQALAYAVAHVVPEHTEEVRKRRTALIERTEAAVKERLTKEIIHWDHRTQQLKAQEEAGQPNARLNSQEARRRADDLQGRLQKRLADLALERQLAALPPVMVGGTLVVPAGLLVKIGAGAAAPTAPTDTQASAARARAIVMDVERQLGYEPVDREMDKLGYDIESRVPATGGLRFIEVKGRVASAETITVTKNEILYSLNKPDDYRLAIVTFHPDDSYLVCYVSQPFGREPDFGVTSVNYRLSELLERGSNPV